jgi:hypothetical protein
MAFEDIHDGCPGNGEIKLYDLTVTVNVTLDDDATHFIFEIWSLEPTTWYSLGEVCMYGYIKIIICMGIHCTFYIQAA